MDRFGFFLCAIGNIVCWYDKMTTHRWRHIRWRHIRWRHTPLITSSRFAEILKYQFVPSFIPLPSSSYLTHPSLLSLLLVATSLLFPPLRFPSLPFSSLPFSFLPFSPLPSISIMGTIRTLLRNHHRPSSQFRRICQRLTPLSQKWPISYPSCPYWCPRQCSYFFHDITV